MSIILLSFSFKFVFAASFNLQLDISNWIIGLKGFLNVFHSQLDKILEDTSAPFPGEESLAAMTGDDR